MTVELTPILGVAKEVLKSAGLKGMHVDNIAAIALKGNQTGGLSASDFSLKLQSSLARNLKLKTQRPSFAKVDGTKKGQFKRGWYRLKIDRSATVIKQIEPPDTDKSFIGKAGEMSVISELLFWGYNASAMLVDSGVDVIASRSGKYFHVQVKTSTERDGKFQFAIRNSSFTQHHDSTMFYVFVLRRGLSNEYVIIPSSYLHALIAGGKIAAAPVLSVTIGVDAKGKKYTLNGSIDVGIYVGNFGGLIV